MTVPVELSTLMWKSLALAAALNDELAEKFSMPVNATPICALGMAHQKITLMLEQTGFYDDYWTDYRPKRPLTQADAEQMIRENGERIMLLPRSAFILALSSIEHCAKHALPTKPGKLPEKKGRIYLNWIMARSAEAGLINEQDARAWEGVIELRNTIIHNNGIAEITDHFEVAGTPGITFVAGEMTKGDLKTVPGLILWVVEAYYRWCNGFLGSTWNGRTIEA